MKYLQNSLKHSTNSEIHGRFLAATCSSRRDSVSVYVRASVMLLSIMLYKSKVSKDMFIWVKQKVALRGMLWCQGQDYQEQQECSEGYGKHRRKAMHFNHSKS